MNSKPYFSTLFALAIPFTFKLYGSQIGQPGVETVVNKATNEQFSISKSKVPKHSPMHLLEMEVEVKRTRAPTRKENISKP